MMEFIEVRVQLHAAPLKLNRLGFVRAMHQLQMLSSPRIRPYTPKLWSIWLRT